MLTTVPTAFDPSHLGDPIASQTAWTPARGGGANFRTHKLIRVGSNRVEFRASTGAVIFYLLFMLIGLAAFVAVTASLSSSRQFSFGLETIMPLLISLIFVAVGGYMFYSGTAPIVFEKGRGMFWKGRKGPDEAMDSRGKGNLVRLDNVHALQMISEYCSGNKSSYYSYELNLVLRNGERINVVDHGNRSKLREDADVLAGFLGKPLWDATEKV
jgi:hypothetical protein